MKYSITPLEGNSRIRDGHSVANAQIGLLGANTTGFGDELWTCTVDHEFTDAKIGDQWLHIMQPAEGWVAVRHGGINWCRLAENKPAEFPPEIYIRIGSEERKYGIVP